MCDKEGQTSKQGTSASLPLCGHRAGAVRPGYVPPCSWALVSLQRVNLGESTDQAGGSGAGGFSSF